MEDLSEALGLNPSASALDQETVSETDVRCCAGGGAMYERGYIVYVYQLYQLFDAGSRLHFCLPRDRGRPWAMR